MSMNREILRLALPNIVSNITVPLMGIVSTAIAGHWGADTAATIGALAIGVSIFNFIYWNCSFVRMGTSGLTAQAFGAVVDAVEAHHRGHQRRGGADVRGAANARTCCCARWPWPW